MGYCPPPTAGELIGIVVAKQPRKRRVHALKHTVQGCQRHPDRGSLKPPREQLLARVQLLKHPRPLALGAALFGYVLEGTHIAARLGLVSAPDGVQQTVLTPFSEDSEVELELEL